MTATYGYLLLQGTSVPTVVVNAVVVVIAFYFGSRATSTPPAVPGQPQPPHPRFVRVLLLLGFLGLTAWFFRLNPSINFGIPRDLLSVLEVLGGYVLGVAVSWIVHRRAHETPRRRRFATFFRDAVAVGALGSTAILCFALATGQLGRFASYAADGLSLVVTFYFGSRVIGH